ncbi:MAG: hypothetical protein KDK50_04095 [Chlamydiia bacterium]|nr:hypothetical protein [Chlamydiia bacterium]
MSIPILKRKISLDEIFQDSNQENKHPKACPATRIAEAIIAEDLQAWVAPIIDDWLQQSSGAMLVDQVYHDQTNDFVVLKIDANHLCIAGKRLGSGHNNFVRKAVVIDSQSFEITAANLKPSSFGMPKSLLITYAHYQPTLK